MQTEYRFRLKPYKVPSDRTECPNCHTRRSFVPYIDTEGKITFPPYVGRCNRENKCGYHYPPKRYFLEHPETKGELVSNQVSTFVATPPKPPVVPYYFPSSMMEQSMKCYQVNNFYLFLKSRFGEEAADGLVRRFHIGTAETTNKISMDGQISISYGELGLYPGLDMNKTTYGDGCVYRRQNARNDCRVFFGSAVHRNRIQPEIQEFVYRS